MFEIHTHIYQSFVSHSPIMQHLCLLELIILTIQYLINLFFAFIFFSLTTGLHHCWKLLQAFARHSLPSTMQHRLNVLSSHIRLDSPCWQTLLACDWLVIDHDLWYRSRWTLWLCMCLSTSFLLSHQSFSACRNSSLQPIAVKAVLHLFIWLSLW